MGADIISQKGKTHYGIATCACVIAKSILNDENMVLPVSVPLKEYDYQISASCLCTIGSKGAKENNETHMNKSERAKFEESVSYLWTVIKGFK